MASLQGYACIREEILERSHRREQRQRTCNERAQHSDRQDRANLIANQQNLPDGTKCLSLARSLASLVQLKQLGNRHLSRALVLLAATALAPLAASADYVVLESSTDRYERGMILSSNIPPELEPGDELKVLDQSGQKFTLLYEERDSQQQQAEFVLAGAAMAASRSAIWTEAQAQIGGTRSTDEETCLAQRTSEDQDCSSGPDEPRMSVMLSSGDMQVTPGLPIWLEARANYEAFVGCRFARPHAPDQGTPWHATSLLPEHMTAFLPARGEPLLRAPEGAGLHEISCLSLDIRTWNTLAESMDLTPEDLWREPVVEAFARLRNAPINTASITLNVR